MDQNIKSILEICDEFLKIPSTVGHEKPFLKHMDEIAQNNNYETIINDNFLVVKPKIKNNNILFSVHIDRQGLILNDENKVEYATNYLKKVQNLPFKRDEQEDDEKLLVKHLNDSIENNPAKLTDDFLIMNLKDLKSLKFYREDGFLFLERLALRYVRENITSYDKETGEKFNTYKTTRYDTIWDEHIVTYKTNKPLKDEDKIFMLDSQIEIFDNMFSAQIDNVISAAVIFYLIKNNQLNCEVIFTTKEEMGESYNSVIDYLKKEEQTKKLIVLDTSPYADFRDKDEGFLTLRYGDERGGFSTELVNNIKSLLEENKISFDFKPSFMGRTELGKVADFTKGKINGTTLQIPSMNYHTTYETATLKSLENYYKIIKILAQS